MATPSATLPSLPSLTSNPTFFPTASASGSSTPLVPSSSPNPSKLPAAGSRTPEPPSTSTSTASHYPPPPTAAPHLPAAHTRQSASPPRVHGRSQTAQKDPNGFGDKDEGAEGVGESDSKAGFRMVKGHGVAGANGLGLGHGTGMGLGMNGMSVSQSQASRAAAEWEMAYERQEEDRWAEKVREDLSGWRGGHGVVRSTYSRAALPGLSYFNQPKTGVIGVHLPKEVVRIERDWTDGEVCQFETSFPIELDGRISPAQFTSLVETINAHLAAAYSVKGAVLDNIITIATWWTSLLWRASCFERELAMAERKIDAANKEVFNPAGLNVLSPRDVALQYLEIEYY